MADFDFDGALRWSRSFPKRQLTLRRHADLPFATADALGGPPLLLDTCVYIDQMQGRAPDLVERLVEIRQTNHSTIAIQELVHTVGLLSPADPRTSAAVATIGRQIKAMRAHRVFAPDADVLGRGALLAGALCRLQHYAADARLRALHDAVLLLQALKLGFTVLTANVGDFDFLLRLVPTGRVIFYRQN